MIEAKGLSKRYGETLAVDDLSFTVEPGKVTGFLGPNGAGKSTTMRIVLGLDNPTSGHALIDGKSYRELRHPLRHVGALLEARWTHPNRSARAHLRWIATSNRIPRARVEEVLELVGLSEVAGKRVGGFSLGMSQRLGIAVALLGDPEVLLFDEPVNGLDPEGIYWVRTLMQNLAEQGRTVLVSSHLLSEMANTANELIVVGRGRLIAQTSTERFVEQATGNAVRVRTPTADRLRWALSSREASVTESEGALWVTGLGIEQVGEAAAAAGIVLHELSPQTGSLEQAFMQMTGQDVQFRAGGAGDGHVPADLAEVLGGGDADQKGGQS
jgi:ABC-2 type transport system ATP-binding protein